MNYRNKTDKDFIVQEIKKEKSKRLHGRSSSSVDGRMVFIMNLLVLRVHLRLR